MNESQSNPARIVLIEDEQPIRRFLQAALPSEGFQLVECETAKQGLLEIASHPPDVVVLDLGLPDVDGMEVLKQLREWSNVPVLVLSARGREGDKVAALDAGADDYLTKPFNPRELVARVRAILRRTSGGRPGPDQPRRLGRLTLNPASREVTVGDEEIALRAREFDLLLALIDHANQVLSRDQLLDLVWGYEYHGQTRTVDVHVAQLRDRLTNSDVEIETVWGRGYKLNVRAA